MSAPAESVDSCVCPDVAAMMCLLTRIVVLIDSNRGRLKNADFEALLQPEDQDLWLDVRNLQGWFSVTKQRRRQINI